MNIRVISPPLAAFAIFVAGCGLSREKAPTAPPGTPQVVGTVVRTGAPAAGMKITLSVHDSADTVVDSTITDGSGHYAFMSVPPGHWVSRVSPTDSADLGYVRAFFEVANPGDAITIPAFDIDVHGLVQVSPPDSAIVPLPSFTSALRFTWTPYQLPYLTASARVSVNGVLAWTSIRNKSTQADWNGVGNRGVFAFQTLPPGTYQWRVKLQLPNSLQAATHLRTLVLQ